VVLFEKELFEEENCGACLGDCCSGDFGSLEDRHCSFGLGLRLICKVDMVIPRFLKL
jgi:hypothetical protein